MLDPKVLQNKVFSKYISGQRIVIADPTTTSRTVLANVLVTMGAKTQNLSLVTSYAEAEVLINELKPKVVICDYDLGKRCGLDLLQKQRLQHPETKDSLFILVTGNTSQSAVARSAEEDIDSYILKPFTREGVMNSIFKTAMLKLDPPEYLRAIEKGKERLAAGKLDEATKEFERARGLDPTPALACFYLGQLELIRKALVQAEGNYLKGLSFNKIHYKCLVGLYEILIANSRHIEAYEVIKKLSHYFPANPQRLTAVLRLAIVTKNYDDIERYYRIFTTIDERNEEMVRYVCAALVVCGKYYLTKKLSSRANELFQKAAITGKTRPKVLREIIAVLIEAGQIDRAEEYFKKFQPMHQSGVDCAAAKLLILNQKGSPSLVIQEGREILAKGIYDPIIYKVLIQRSIEARLDSAAENLILDACTRWPDQKDAFKSLLS